MERLAAGLHRAFLDDFRPYLESLLVTRGWPFIPEAVEAAVARLDITLSELLARPFAEQRRGPLEVFQEAMEGPNQALAAAGVEAPGRDPAAVAALPGDVYDLAPASSQDLGEAAWSAHVAWGAAKAAAVRPVLLALASNLLDLDRIEGIAGSVGYRLARLPQGGAETSRQAVVDLEHPDADRVIADLAAAGVKVFAFGPHVDDLAMVRARTLGADAVEPRSRFFNRLGPWLRPLV